MPQPAVSPFDAEGGSEALTPLQAHYRGYLRAVFAEGHEAEARWHSRWIEAAEHGDPDPDAYAGRKPDAE